MKIFTESEWYKRLHDAANCGWPTPTVRASDLQNCLATIRVLEQDHFAGQLLIKMLQEELGKL